MTSAVPPAPPPAARPDATATAPGRISCAFTMVLLPFAERELGPEGAEALVRAAGRPREYLLAEYNWLPVPLMDSLVQACREMMGEPDEDRWARRFGEYFMEWKPREQRSWAGTYTMAAGSPRWVYERAINLPLIRHWATPRLLSIGRRRAVLELRPQPGVRVPLWLCSTLKICWQRFPLNWGLPLARIDEDRCAARGADACVWDIRWTNPSLGPRFWLPTAAGAGTAVGLGLALATTTLTPLAACGLAALPAGWGVTAGYALLQRHRRRHNRRMLDLQAEEILHSSGQLEQKFRDLESKIEQLSLLVELSAAVNATLDVEKIYDQALQRLVHQMGYENVHLYLVDRDRGVLRGHRMAGHDPEAARRFEGTELPLDAEQSANARAALTGLPVLVNDVDQATSVHVPTARTYDIRAFVAVPLRVKERIFGVVTANSSTPGRFAEADVELIATVANHVALALDRAESFQTIEDLTRGLEDKVRVRTEQLRAANEELQAAYRDLQATQMQLIQREKMASVGQLVAGVAHELNNPIGFVYSNVTTLEDFVRRLRTVLDAYRAAPLGEADRQQLEEQWRALKVDYALKYLDSMIHGIREGAERARKIVRDLRVFARTQDEVWQAADLHEELESSLTLLNHLLKDRITVERRYGALPAVECIRSQIDQVFLNLLANAAQAIPREGTITIETRREGDDAVVVVADTGTGIPPEIVGKIFDPFFTTKPVGEGTGLGLSISYEIVKKHGGDIRVASAPGQGATFTLRLPVTRSR
ncbi:MAG TPA: ATP-binding protein [Candidatus Tectomicrobia bacterium]|nr:ATP-binding protein [Candidatus Tectomicrobia bacterium]